MLLIADSGATKTEWVLTGSGNAIMGRYATKGYSPYFMSSDEIFHSLRDDLIHQFEAAQVKQLFYYGTGCSTPGRKAIVQEALQQAFPHAQISVGHDLLAAAKALLGDQTGFAAILGTGTNTCIYDGSECHILIDSLGYLMGDEGSGCAIGKKFLRDYMRKQFPADVQSVFVSKFGEATNEEILKALYGSELPSRYLASFSRLATDLMDHPYIGKIVGESFEELFRNLVSLYPGYQSYTFNCVGSIGYTFRDLLSQTAAKYGMKTGRIIQSPMEGLITYHQAH